MPEGFKTYPFVILRQAQDKLQCVSLRLSKAIYLPSPQRMNAQLIFGSQKSVVENPFSLYVYNVLFGQINIDELIFIRNNQQFLIMRHYLTEWGSK
jgi:hypothetical protein